jgi:hypothetical protein
MTGWYDIGREERVERDIEGKRQVREFGIRERWMRMNSR